MNNHSGLGPIHIAAILLIFLSGSLSCADSSSGQIENVSSSSCATFGTSVDDLIAMDDLVLSLLEQGKYEAASSCVAHQIDLGYSTPPKYVDLTIYLAYAGFCTKAKDSQQQYLRLMTNRNENSPVPYSQMEDPAAAKTEEAIAACEESETIKKTGE